MATEVVFEKQGSLGRITFTAPNGINILSTSVIQALTERLDEIAKDPEVRVLILTGAGKTFLAGADISEMSNAPTDAGKGFSERGQAGFAKLAGFTHAVTIAAINGAAFGGGCEVALACDLRVMSDKAKIGMPEVKLGLIPGWGGTQRSLALLGSARARRMVFTGEALPGDLAAEIGLVNQCVPADGLIAAAEDLANQILSGGPTAIRCAKQAMCAAEAAMLKTGLAAEADAFAEAFASDQGREGLKAFLEKRKPDW